MGELCRTIAGEKYCLEYPQVNSIIEKARPSVFSFDYPIFNTDYKVTLEHKILRHYYMQEIGLETVGQWKLKLEDKLNLIMPYYNQLYESAQLKIDPFNDVDYTRENSTNTSGTESSKGQTVNTGNATNVSNENYSEETTNTGNTESVTNENGKTTGTNTSESKTTRQEVGSSGSDHTHTSVHEETKRYSDTPQGGLTGVYNDRYLTSAEVNNSSDHDTDTTNDEHKITTSRTESTSGSTSGTSEKNAKTTGLHSDIDKTSTQKVKNDQSTTSDEQHTQSSGENSTTASFIEHIYGKTNNKSYASLLNELRDTFINIDLMIIEDLSDLFMSVWE